jgi:dCMP deaminase
LVYDRLKVVLAQGQGDYSLAFFVLHFAWLLSKMGKLNNMEKVLEKPGEKYIRPTWDEYFLGLLEPIGRRATCDRGRSGSVIVSQNNTILSTGYVGSPPGQPHCDDVGHLMKTLTHEDGHQSQHCMRTLHAEENAILQAAKDGIKMEYATIYTKMTPCYNCAMRIVRVGIKRVVAQKRYHADGQSMELFASAGVEVLVLDNNLEAYKHQ